MKKLLIFSHSSVLEINRHIYYQLSAIYKVEIKIISPASWKGDLIKNLSNQKNTSFPEVEILSLPIMFSGNGSLFFYKINLSRLFHDWVPDLVFVDEEPWSLACFQIFHAFPKAELFFYTKQNLRKKLPFPFNLIQKYIFKKSKQCFSVADEVSEVLRWKGFRGEISYLPHSFDPEKFFPQQNQNKSATRSLLGIAEDCLVVGYFGRLDSEKGILDLLSAIKIVDRSLTQKKPHFLIVGNGALKEEILSFATQNKNINITLRQAIPHDDVGTVLGIIDVLVLPSKTMRNWKEQFGRILVEAMACGAAVIGSDSGEIPHLVKKSGSGLVFHEGCPSELAEMITLMMKDAIKLKQAQQNGISFAHNTLTHKKVATDLGEKLGLTAIDFG